MKVPIYKNRQIPPKSVSGRNKTGRKYVYPWTELEVGDCFAGFCTNTAMKSIIRYQQKKLGHRYTLRQIDGKQWVWRIA